MGQRRVWMIGAALLLGLVACGGGASESGPDEALDAGQDPDAEAPDAEAPEVDGPDAEPDAQESDAEPDAEPDAEEPVFGEDPLTWAPGLPGPFRTGYRSWEVTYTPPGAEEPRTIVLNLWYPTEATEGAPARYMGTRTFQDPASLVDAPLAGPVHGERFPVHVHSHGSQGFGGTSAFLMRHLASHGWVSVAPDHTGNTLLDDLNPRPVGMYIWRSADITEVLDELARLPEGDPLAGKLALERVVMSGHSFGTMTSWASLGATFDSDGLDAECEGAGGCTEAEREVFLAGLGDPRVAAAIPMAGAYRESWFGARGWEAVTAPVLSMTGTEDNVGQVAQWEKLAEMTGLTWIELEGGCHQTFALGICGTLPPPEGFTIVGTYALAFARAHILGDEGQEVTGILSGAVEVDPRAQLQRR